VVFISYFIKQCCSFVHPKVLTTADYTVVKNIISLSLF
jgi:hypothetical protein